MLLNYLRLTIGKISPSSDQQRRYVRILQAILTGFADRGISMVVGFLAVPLSVGYLGAERYGVWIAISSILTWLAIADLGMSNSLTNALSGAYGRNERGQAQQHVASVFWSLTGVAALIAIGAIIVWMYIDWGDLFKVHDDNTRSEVRPAVLLAFLLACLSIPLSVIPKILYAYQEGTKANYWNAIASLASLIALLIVVELQLGLIGLIMAYTGVRLLVSIFSGIWLFGFHKPWLRPNLASIRRDSLGSSIKVGGFFLLLQISSIIILSTDNIIIANALGASEVTPYSVTWRLFWYISIPSAIIRPVLWPAFAEAFVRNDMRWIRRTLGIYTVTGLGIGLIGVVPLTVFGVNIIEWWAGPEARPSQLLIILMGVFILLWIYLESLSTILASATRIRWQAVYGSITAVTNIFLSIWWVHAYGTTGVIMATIISCFLFSALPSTYETIVLLTKRT
jgi:O-antigen/teichoic acid export membrane protein